MVPVQSVPSAASTQVVPVIVVFPTAPEQLVLAYTMQLAALEQLVHRSLVCLPIAGSEDVYLHVEQQ